jgi:hypothetical protein
MKLLTGKLSHMSPKEKLRTYKKHLKTLLSSIKKSKSLKRREEKLSQKSKSPSRVQNYVKTEFYPSKDINSSPRSISGDSTSSTSSLNLIITQIPTEN